MSTILAGNTIKVQIQSSNQMKYTAEYYEAMQGQMATVREVKTTVQFVKQYGSERPMNVPTYLVDFDTPIVIRNGLVKAFHIVQEDLVLVETA